MGQLPSIQRAVQLVGPDELVFNKSKEVFTPRAHQILCQVEAVGLCFSDLKLLKQFSGHARKSEILSGIEQEVLKEIASYVPDEAPTVPGHESVVRVAAVGQGVKDFKVGQRYLVQTDYRWLPTENSNASYGYNFEGGLQEYVLIDERVITSPEGDSMLIPVSEELSASAVALIEPWACVEDAYASRERTGVKEGGQMLIVADEQVPEGVIANLLSQYGRPAKITWVSKSKAPAGLDAEVAGCGNIAELADAGYDDVIYFGSCAETAEALFAKVAIQGLFNIVQCGGKFGKDVVTQVGRVHYGGIRLIGTTGSDPAEAMEYIPQTGEIRPGDKINVIGAGGPMGVMHVIRDICQGVEGVSVYAGDMDDARLETLTKIAAPLAEKNKVQYKPYNPKTERIEEAFDYVALMAPIPALVTSSVNSAAKGAIINIFAGIAANVTADINLDAYIDKHLYFVGTSGSVLEDMKQVLAKVEANQLDTNVSVAAICGIEKATQGIRAVENRLIAGKIVVYPSCKGLELIELEQLQEKMPEVADCLRDGLWTRQAEQKLLSRFE